MTNICQMVSAVREEIRSAARRSGRDVGSIQLVAVTKFVPAEKVEEAIQAGVTVCGENRAQEALVKMGSLSSIPDVRWHFIGRIQKRKIKSIIGQFELIHSVESLDQAEEMNRRSQEMGIQQSVLVEVNVGHEEQKGGFSPLALLNAIPRLDQFMHLTIKGLMAIPPWAPDPESARPYFRQLRELAEQVREAVPTRMCMTELSMGMSEDFGVAIEEGATMVRVGTKIFGVRQR